MIGIDDMDGLIEVSLAIAKKRAWERERKAEWRNRPVDISSDILIMINRYIYLIDIPIGRTSFSTWHQDRISISPSYLEF